MYKLIKLTNICWVMAKGPIDFTEYWGLVHARTDSIHGVFEEGELLHCSYRTHKIKGCNACVEGMPPGIELLLRIETCSLSMR